MTSAMRQEIEYLWPPCSFIQPSGDAYIQPTSDGPVTIIPVRVNANQRTMSVEQMLSQKKAMHLAAFRHLLEETRRYLWSEKEKFLCRKLQDYSLCLAEKKLKKKIHLKDFAESIMLDCKKVHTRHESKDSNDYTDDDIFRGMVIEMLEVKRMAKSKLELYLYERRVYFSLVADMTLRQAHRARLVGLERNMELLEDGEEKKRRALELCKVKGLVMESVHEQNEEGEEKILEAAADGWLGKDLRLLLHAGAKLTSKGEKGKTVVMIAAASGHTATVQALHALGADIFPARADGRTAVMLAAQGGHTTTVLALDALGADVKAVDGVGWTAMMLAAVGGHSSCVQALYTLGADVLHRTKEGAAAVTVAAAFGHDETIKLLYQLRADVNAKKADGVTPLLLAARSGHATTVRILHALGADMNAGDSDGRTGVMLAAKAGHTDAVRALHDLRVNLNARDDCGWTALILAAQGRHNPTVQALRELGAEFGDIFQAFDESVAGDMDTEVLDEALLARWQTLASALLQRHAA